MGAFIIALSTYGQVGFIVNFYFYVKCFVDDIRLQLKNVEETTELELKKSLIDAIELQLLIIR